MSNIIINKTILLAVFPLFIGCKENKEQIIQKQRGEPLVFNVNFKTFENIKLAHDEKKMMIDSAIWNDHLQDSIVYFKINFENLKKEPLILKTSLIASKIPFFLKYSKGTEDKVILEIVQQLNTIYSDSIILTNDKISDFPVVKNAYRIGYQHSGVDEVCQLKVNQHHDTIDISNKKMENCIEKER